MPSSIDHSRQNAGSRPGALNLHLWVYYARNRTSKEAYSPQQLARVDPPRYRDRMTFQDLLRARYSCRAYRTDPIPPEQVSQCLEAARLAPSACNKQPWRFAVVSDAEKRQAIVSRGFRGGLPMKWALRAPILIVIGMERSIFTHRVATALSKVDYPWIDIGIAGEHLVLQATEFGLGTCWIGWINPKRLRRIVGWPRSVTPAAVITLGFPAAVQQNRRPRKPLDEICKRL